MDEEIIEVTTEQYANQEFRENLRLSNKDYRIISPNGLRITVMKPAKLPEDLRIDGLERQNKSLKSHIKALEQELEQSERTIAQLDAHIEFLELENEDLHRQIDRR